MLFKAPSTKLGYSTGSRTRISKVESAYYESKNNKNDQYEINIGVDTGKQQLDIYIRPLDIFFTVSNDEKGIKEAIKKIKPHHPTRIIIGLDYDQDYKTMRSQLTHMNVSVPTLYKQYADLCEMGGVRFIDFNIDENFSRCIDGLVMVDLQQLKPSKHKRYLG